MPVWADAFLPVRRPPPKSNPPAPADAPNLMKSLRVIVLIICPTPLFLLKGGASGASMVVTPPPFGSPAACPPLLKKQAHGLCAPTSRQVCLYRDAGAPALMRTMVQQWRLPVHGSGGHL